MRNRWSNPGKIQLAVTYTVPGASCMPAYDARLHSASRTVELSYFGVVRQNTGEDWGNVALTLSTARPSLGGAAPELAPWSVSVWQNPRAALNLKDAPVSNSMINRAFIDALGIKDLNEAASWAGPQRNFFQKGATANDKYAVESFDFGRGPSAALFGGAGTDVQTGLAGVNSLLTSATFQVVSPTSVPSNNSTQKVAISSGNLAATLKYNASPKLRENAFLSARAANESDYPLLAGPTNAFLDDVFIASGNLRTIMPGEEFELPPGADDAIAIKRRSVNRFQENTGLSNSGRRVTYEYQITVTNNKKTAEKITLREPLPVSKDEKVVVKVLVPTEREIGSGEKVREIMREASGALAWQFELKPGERRDVTLKFSVEHPADVAVVGLE